MKSFEICVGFSPRSPTVCESGLRVPLPEHGEMLIMPVVHFMFSNTSLCSLAGCGAALWGGGGQ